MHDRSRSRLRPRVLAVEGDAGAAAERIIAELATATPALVLLFAAEGALLAPLTGRLREAFGAGCRVLGCSSAGSFAFGGYCDDRVVPSPSRPRPFVPRRSGCATCASTWRSTGSARFGGSPPASAGWRPAGRASGF
jgi:hypothetical protein